MSSRRLRLLMLAPTVLLAGVTMVAVAPPAHASYPSSVTATAVASHPNGWVAVKEYVLDDDLGTHAGLLLRGVSTSGAWGWGLTIPGCLFGPPEACTAARKPAIAFNGTNFLVVWEDNRNGGWDIYGALVSPTGTVVKQPFKVSNATGDQVSPSVAGLGTQFLVVWQDHRVGTNADIYSSRVSGSGAVASPTGVKVSGASNLQANPSVAANGASWLVVWSDKRNGATTGVDVYSTRVTTAGAVSSPNGVVVSKATRDQFKPVVVWNGTNYLTAWTDSRNSSVNWDIYGSRISTAGATLDASGIAISRAAGAQSQPALSRSNSRVLVVWTNQETYGSSILSRFVTTTGSLSSVVPVVSNCASWGCDPARPAASAVGGTVLVVFRTNTGFQDNVFGQRVSSGGALIGPLVPEYG